MKEEEDQEVFVFKSHHDEFHNLANNNHIINIRVQKIYMHICISCVNSGSFITCFTAVPFLCGQNRDEMASFLFVFRSVVFFLKGQEKEEEEVSKK